MIVSVVIPTYGGERLGATLDALLASYTEGLDAVEILVVDDGSPEPVAPVVEAKSADGPITLSCIRQENAGPAKARNTGLRYARGEIVLFIDNDIICPPDLIRRHVAAHAGRPGSVIFGRCPFAEPDPITPIYRYLNSLRHDAGKHSVEEFLQVDSVASGQLSVRRDMFDPAEGVYSDRMATPSAEEFDLEARLHVLGVPIYLATRIEAIHNHEVSIKMLCDQARKYGRGFAEVSIKNPEALSYRPSLLAICELNGPLRRGESCYLRAKKLALRMLAMAPSLAMLTSTVSRLERMGPGSPVLPFLYKCLLASHTYIGFQKGLSAFLPRAGVSEDRGVVYPASTGAIQ